MQPLNSISALSPWEPGLSALILYSLAVFFLILVLLFLASWLGEKKIGPEKKRPFECGIVPTGAAQLLHPVPFYLVAVFFIIFDVEAGFILAWAVAARELAWAGWLQISFFILLLLAGLFYLWKKQGLKWVQGLEKTGSAQE